MILDYRTIRIALSLLIMLLELSHLDIHAHSTAFKINKDSSDNHRALQEFSKSFSTESLTNFSIFHLIHQNGQTSLFVVCKNDTIIQIAIENMEMINIYRKENCSISLKYKCDESFNINLLSEINFFNQKMIWFCYILHHSSIPSPSTTHCLVPKNNVLNEEVRWTKTGFSSTSEFYRTFAVQSQPYIFIGSYRKDSLLVIRTKLPNINGVIDTTTDLFTPMADFYFERNAHFLEVFATKYDVYYVLEEPLTAKSHSIAECVASSDTSTVISTRLMRICKDDLGGVADFNEKNFGTAAKADIVCPVGSGTDQHYYTRSISASWSGDKLYILFESQKNAPPGKVLCVYDVIAFNVAFNSDMIPPQIFPTDSSPNTIKNPIADLCRKLSEKSLDENEMLEARSISTNGLYRSKNVSPIKTVPLLKLRNLSYSSISTFRLSSFDPTTVIVLIADNFIRLLSHMDTDDICHIQDFQFEKSESISQVKGDSIQSKVFVHISTNKRMVQLELSMCARFPEKVSCLRDAPRICGWDSGTGRCKLLTGEVDPRQWERSNCTHIRVDDIWSLPEKCQVKNEQVSMSCTCKYCLEEAGCPEGKRIDITNCSGARNVDVYEQWSEWSECSPSKHQTRTRKCTTAKCSANNIEYRVCHITTSSVSTTNWTKWYRSLNPKYQISFRAKCPANRLLPPTIEEREKICGESCLDDSMAWSGWSECAETSIQYRLLNCSSFDMCPYTKTEVKTCPRLSSRQLQNDTEGGYSIIHIALVILIVSLAWLFIVIFIFIGWFRRNQTKKKKKRQRPRLHTYGSTPHRTYQPPFMLQQSLVSETSNAYITPDIPALLHSPSLLRSAMQNPIITETASESNNTIYSNIPFTNDIHSNILQH